MRLKANASELRFPERRHSEAGFGPKNLAYARAETLRSTSG